MENPKELQKLFKRVTVHYGDAMTDEELALAMTKIQQVLTIVNTRRHARMLFDKLMEKTQDGVYHLSARMCPVHRKKVLTEIRQALRENRLCRVVSTQLIEAGVDVDFPYVYRAAAGIDSIAQAAGRCNREGKHTDGLVTVFDPEKHGMPSRGRFAATAALTRSTIRNIDKFEGELLSLAAIDYYFKQLLDLERDNLDVQQILNKIEEGKCDLAFPFATIARDFNIIDSETVAVIVPWDDKAKMLMGEVEAGAISVGIIRRLQPYIVQIYQYELDALQKEEAVRKVGDFLYFVDDYDYYDDCFGLKEAKEVKSPKDVLIF
jgi:hypothetical protein